MQNQWKTAGGKLYAELSDKFDSAEGSDILAIAMGKLLAGRKRDLERAAYALVESLRGEFNQPGPPILIVQEAQKILRKENRQVAKDATRGKFR
jgi:hypothetical protein